MPPLVQRYVKTSLVFFLLGLGSGAAMSLAWSYLAWPSPRFLVVAHVHVLLVGFVLMMIMGVATWMFPRPGRDDRSYSPELATAIYWIMTVSTAVRFLTEVVLAYRPGRGLVTLATLGGLGQVLASILFIFNMWSRIRAPSMMRSE